MNLDAAQRLPATPDAFRFRVLLNGRRHLNSPLQGVQIDGTIRRTDPKVSLLTILHHVAQTAEDNSREFEHVEAIEVQIVPEGER